MFVVDASVHVNALNPSEAGHRASRDFLARVRSEHIVLAGPEILIAEVAAAVARALDDAAAALRLALALRGVPDFRFFPVDASLADAAAEMSARYRLRGCDAIYVALADRLSVPLVTLDRQQRERGAKAVRTLRPDEALAYLPPRE